MKNLLISLLSLVLITCNTTAQVDITKLTPAQWAEDITYLQSQWSKKHVNLFHTAKKEDYENAFTLLKKRVELLTADEIMVELMRIGAMIKDGHTDVTPVSLRYPLRFGSFNGKIYVTSATAKYSNAVGGQVLKCDDVEIDKVVELLTPLVDGDNEMEIPRKVPDFLGMANVMSGLHIIKNINDAKFTILTEQGEQITLQVSPVEEGKSNSRINAIEKASAKMPMYMENMGTFYWYKYLPESNSLYFQYNTCNDQKGQKTIADFADEIFQFIDNNKIDYFVIDLRHNPGGNFKKSKPIVDGIKNRASINQKGKLFLLTSRNTGSAATVTGAMLKTMTNAIIIGEMSRANPNFTYNAEHFTLPNSKLSVGYTESLHNPFPQLGKTLQVDIQAENSFDDFKNGRDRVLETVYLKANN